MKLPKVVAIFAALAGCANGPATPTQAATEVAPSSDKQPSYYGTLDPFAANAVYFVVTDRFVNGDRNNDHRDQGGANRTFDIPLKCPDGVVDNIGYLGGDFKGLLAHADYIRDMGFGAVWITPIVENPDESFTGGDAITCTSFLTDKGKSGYHGYWGTNFFKVDEHLESSDLRFRDLTRGLKEKGLKTVLDIVANHSSPGFTMPKAQVGFGQLFDASGKLVADHQNLAPEQLNPAGNPLHRWYNTKKDLAQLADLNGDLPEVRKYFVDAYSQWIDHGVDAFRIDTIRHQTKDFWREFSSAIRAQHPGFYMFGEAFDYKAENIAVFTKPEAGSISVLDFPMKAGMVAAFENGAGYEALLPALYLENAPYANTYELATFYDNHDMARLKATDAGFIDANNWLFTVRGIPVIYYGSEMGFMRGRVEHNGNRNYFGADNIALAKQHVIHSNLRQIAKVRLASIALQRGVQINLALSGDTASFYRVYQHQGVAQTALVLLNKADQQRRISVNRFVQSGVWLEAITGQALSVTDAFNVDVPAHGVRVFLLDSVVKNAALETELARVAK